MSVQMTAWKRSKIKENNISFFYGVVFYFVESSLITPNALFILKTAAQTEFWRIEGLTEREMAKKFMSYATLSLC
jgi:hypothetical protein